MRPREQERRDRRQQFTDDELLELALTDTVALICGNANTVVGRQVVPEGK